MKAGFLPELSERHSPPLTLTNNDSGKFECRWVYLSVNQSSPCVFTKGSSACTCRWRTGRARLSATWRHSGQNVVVHYTDAKGNPSRRLPVEPQRLGGQHRRHLRPFRAGLRPDAPPRAPYPWHSAPAVDEAGRQKARRRLRSLPERRQIRQIPLKSPSRQTSTLN